MGVRFPFVATSTRVNSTIVTTTETVVYTTPPINLTYDGAIVLIVWGLNWVAGTGTTSVQYNLRRGTLVTSPVIYAQPVTNVVETPGNAAQRAGVYFDSPGISANIQYSLTILQNAATANGTVTDGTLVALLL